MATKLTTEQVKLLKEHIVVKPTGKFFIFGKNSFPYTTDPDELAKIIVAIEKPETTYAEGDR